MNTVTAVTTASEQQIKANVARWRQEHGLEAKPTRRFVNRPTFTHKGDRVALTVRGK